MIGERYVRLVEIIKNELPLMDVYDLFEKLIACGDCPLIEECTDDECTKILWNWVHEDEDVRM